MDLLDRRLLSQLETDASRTHEALGASVGLSASATHRRVKALEAAGLIQGYRACLSAAARGNPTTVFVQVTLVDQRRETMEAFEGALRRTRQVREAYLMSGESDYLLKVLVVEDDSYERIHRTVLAGLPGVHRLVSQFTIRTLADG